MEADYRPFHSEPLCGSIEVSYGDRSVSSPLGAEERLDGYDRSERCLPSDSHSSTEPQVSKVHSQGEGLAVQGSLLLAVHSASGFHPGPGSGFRNHASPGRPDVEVSGRLADHGLFSSRGLLGKGHGSPAMSRVGIIVNLEKSSLIPS